jgi:uncharacterized membrane protein required for colicin V production
MIAAAVQKSSWSFDKLTFGWFDIALILILAFGLWRGRKRGMSRELLPVLMWLGIVLAGGFGYLLLADELIKTTYIRKIFGTTFIERTAGNITAYLTITFVVWLLFAVLKNLCKTKVEGANAFGSGEYYLGMISGMIRYACIVIFALALINAPFYSSEELNARAAYNKRWYGGGIYDGNYMGDMPSFQNSIFRNSIVGPLIKNHLSSLLIDNFAVLKKPANAAKP